MSAYLIGTINISDPSWVPEYTAGVQKMFDEIGVYYHVRSAKLEKLEGNNDTPDFAIVIEFPSMEIAREWYNSDEYQKLIQVRSKGSETQLWLTEGV